MASPAVQERAALATLLADLGPDAATLCEGWDTRHLAAHLVTRETRFDAVPGILVPALHGHTARLEDRTRTTVGYDELVQSVAAGPPIGRTLVGLPGMAGPVNVHEFFVHHEDVRRGQPGWQHRELSSVLEDALWRRLRLLAPVLFAGLRGVRLTLATPDGRRRTVGRGPADATLTGAVSELFLYAFGRRDAADVTLSGSAEGRERLVAADLRQ
jgi:uncharacterized protein (TIGR03085 family)